MTQSARAFQVLAKIMMHYPTPLINQDEDGRDICEWWDGDRKLTLHVDQDPMVVVKVSNVDVGNGHGDMCICDECMPEVQLHNVDTFVEDFASLWEWLHYDSSYAKVSLEYCDTIKDPTTVLK